MATAGIIQNDSDTKKIFEISVQPPALLMLPCHLHWLYIQGFSKLTFT